MKGLVAWGNLMGRGEEKPNALPPLLKILAAVGLVPLEALLFVLDEGLLSFSLWWDMCAAAPACVVAFEGVTVLAALLEFVIEHGLGNACEV